MSEIPTFEKLIELLARLPGLGPRSARRVAFDLLNKRDTLMRPLAETMHKVASDLQHCARCGNIASGDRCAICLNPERDHTQICIVEDILALWAMERSGQFKGLYHVLGGVLSALDGVGPDELRVPLLMKYVQEEAVDEVILALNMTIDGQTTAHYIADLLRKNNVRVTSLAQGVPFGGELDYLDEGTIQAALKARRVLE